MTSSEETRQKPLSLLLRCLPEFCPRCHLGALPGISCCHLLAGLSPPRFHWAVLRTLEPIRNYLNVGHTSLGQGSDPPSPEEGRDEGRGLSSLLKIQASQCIHRGLRARQTLPDGPDTFLTSESRPTFKCHDCPLISTLSSYNFKGKKFFELSLVGSPKATYGHHSLNFNFEK